MKAKKRFVCEHWEVNEAGHIQVPEAGCDIDKSSHGITTPNIVRPCLMSKGYIDLPSPALPKYVCCPRSMMACQAQRCLTMYTVQGQWWYTTPNVVWPYMLSKGDYLCHADIVFTCVQSKRDDGMQCPTSFIHVCYTRLMMSFLDWHHPTLFVVQWLWLECHARCDSTVSVFYDLWWHAMHDIVR